MGQQRRSRVWSSVGLSLLIAAITYVIIYKYFPMVYAIVDDVMMRDIASGAMTGKPDGHLIFMKYALGVLISGMYQIFPGIDWYGLLMSGLIMLCLAIVLYRGLSDIQARRNRILYVLLTAFLFFCTGLQHAVSFQWTVTAGIAGATGVFLLYTSPEQDRRRSVIEEIIAAFLLILTFCIRDMMFLMILPAAGICYLFKYVRFHRERRRLSVRHIWFWPLLLSGCAVIMLIEAFAYREEGWKEYKEFNAYRAQYYDYNRSPDFQENQDFYASIDMDEAEELALRHYSLFLVDGVSEYKLKEITDYTEGWERYSSKAAWKCLVDGVQRIYRDYQESTYVPLTWSVMLAIVIAGVLFLKRRSMRLYLLLSCMAMQLLLWLYLGFYGRIVSRVSFPMHIYMLLLTGAFLYRELLEHPLDWINFKEGEQKTVAIVCGAMFLLLSVLEWGAVQKDANWSAEHNEERVALCKYIEDHKENIYFLHTGSASDYGENFQITKNFEVSNSIFMGSWLSFSPLDRERMEYLGISDMEDALYRQENVYLLSRVDTTYVDNCLKKKYGSCHSETVDTIEFQEYTFKIEKFSE